VELETGTFGTDASVECHDAQRPPQCYYLVADRVRTREAALDGYAGLFARPGGWARRDIQTIAVAETARRGGLRRALMNALIGEARTRGKEVFLEVRADSPGPKRLYETLGFEEIAVRVGYYQPDGVDAIVMRLDLPDPVTRPAVGRVTGASDLSGSAPLVLGIETSCDETGIGIVQGHDHARQRDLLLDGRACPLWRCRARDCSPRTSRRAGPGSSRPLAEAGVTLARTRRHRRDERTRPLRCAHGEMESGAAKALAIALDKPIYAINHLVGHVGAECRCDDGTDIQLPTIALLVSGGHTSLLHVRDLIADVRAAR
jgi:N6-L-threonylcarbamoyladenine synthase